MVRQVLSESWLYAAVVRWKEVPTPLTPTRGLIAWGELEIPNVVARGLLAWAEFELPSAHMCFGADGLSHTIVPVTYAWSQRLLMRGPASGVPPYRRRPIYIRKTETEWRQVGWETLPADDAVAYPDWEMF